jgi:hypothetical protein
MRMTLYLYRDGLKLDKERLRRSANYQEVALREPDEPDVQRRFFFQQRPQHPSAVAVTRTAAIPVAR